MHDGFYAALFLAVLCCLSVLSTAQQNTASGQPPPALTAQSARPPTSDTSSSGEDPFQLLNRRSSFFPNLASTLGPLTTEQKFKLFLNNSVSGSAFTRAAAGAGISQGSETNLGYGQEAGAYGKRFGASLASTASTNFFGTFLLASWLHQDPRFFVKKDLNFGETVKYSFQRAVVTRSDQGNPVFNWSGLLAPLAAQGLANVYLPSDQRTVGHTFSRYGLSVGLGVGGNFLRQYWPYIFKHLLSPVVGYGTTSQPSGSKSANPTP